ncbi:MAG: hypothetical protein WA700_07385 [Acidobacteriaceae bacterium]
MSFKANVLKVMIASPDEVSEERKIVTGAIYRWNDANASVRQLVLLPIKWEAHSTPQLGVPAHTVINRQLLDDADFVIGIFGTPVGTPTQEYIGGTVEEIKKHVAAGKTAKVYFSEVPSVQKRVDQNQHALVQKFREELSSSGLYAIYESMEQFRDDFEHHLAIEMNHPRYRWLEVPDRTAAHPQPKMSASDESQKNHVDELLRSVGCVQRDLLRFLLLKGGIARVDVIAKAHTVRSALDMNSLIGPLVRNGLLTRKADQMNGPSLLAVNERMIEILRKSLFPREEDDAPFFDGI